MTSRKGLARIGGQQVPAWLRGIMLSILIAGGLAVASAATTRPSGSRTASIQTVVSSPTETPGTPTPGIPVMAQQLPTGMTLDLLAHEGVMFAGTISAAAFRLQRIEIPPGAEAPPQSVGAPDVLVPELLLVEIGSVELRDELGLTTTLTPDAQFVVNAGATYTLRNPGAEPVTLLRLAFSVPSDGGMGTPVAEAASGTAITILIEGTVDEIIGDGYSDQFTLFIGRATFQPGFDAPVHGHTGPIGFVIETGTLSVTGPSGVEGQLTTGTGVLLPAYEAHRERNAGTEPVSALMVGYVGEDVGLYPAPEPAPVATPVPAPLSEAIVGRWELHNRDGYLTMSLICTADGRFRLEDDDGDVSFGQYHVVDETRVQLVSADTAASIAVTVTEDRLTYEDQGTVLYRVVDSVSTQPQPVEANAQNVIQGTWSNSAETWTFYGDGTVTYFDPDDGETDVGSYWFLDDDTVRLDIFGSLVADVTITQLEGSPDEMEFIIDGDTYTYERESY